MQACYVTITTTVDGRETTISREGEVSLQTPVSLRYEEENARVTLALERTTARIERMGDYGLSLRLVQGQTTDGTLFLDGAEGAIRTQTTRVGYSVTDASLLVSLQYALVFHEERQNMRLRISARVKK